MRWALMKLNFFNKNPKFYSIEVYFKVVKNPVPVRCGIEKYYTTRKIGPKTHPFVVCEIATYVHERWKYATWILLTQNLPIFCGLLHEIMQPKIWTKPPLSNRSCFYLVSLVLLYSTINGRAKCTVLFRGVSPSVTRLECIQYVEVQTPITPFLLLGGFEPELPTP